MELKLEFVPLQLLNLLLSHDGDLIVLCAQGLQLSSLGSEVVLGAF